MASILTLSAGGESVDFIAGTEFSVTKEGLELPPPEQVRVMSGAPPLREGQSLIDRKYANREITITFHADTQTNDALQAAISKLHRIVNYAAKAQASRSMLAGATLQVKLEEMTDTVTFDILDGEVRMQSPFSRLVRREGPMLDNELILTALPYGRGAVVRLENHLPNPLFDINPIEEGRDGGYYVTFGATGVRYERTDATGLFPSLGVRFMASTWVYPTGASGTAEVIARCGNVWELTYVPDDDSFEFQIAGLALSPKAVTSGSTFPINNWYNVTVLSIVTEGTAAASMLMIFVNAKLAGYVNHTETNLAAQSGDFSVGADEDNTRRFNGRICGLSVVLRNIWPWQQKLLFKYGMRSLIRGDDTIPGHSYWDFPTAEYGAVWPFDESSGNQLDDGPGSRTLTLIGSPTFTQNLRLPQGWTVTADLANNRFLQLASANAKYGRFSVHFDKSATGANEPTIKATVTIPAHKQASGADRDWELFFWAISDGVDNALRLKITGSPSATSHFNADVTIPNTLTLFGVKFTNDASDTSFEIEIGQIISGTLLDVHLANVMLVPGTPFGMTGTPTAVTKQVPFISAMGLIAGEDSHDSPGKSRQLRVYNLPGDFVASRTYVENPA